MVIAIALLGFNDLGHSVTPTFLFRNRFYLQLSPHCPKMNQKTQCGKSKKFQDFCPRDMESCHLTATRRVKLWTLIVNLFFEEPHQLTKFALHTVGPLKPYLAGNISLQSSNCNILGLAAAVAFFANRAQVTQI